MLLFLYCFFSSPLVVAGNSIDCSDIAVDYTDEEGLTREEKLARMDKALMDSLNKFELCQQSAQASDSANSQTGGANNESGDGNSNAAGDLQGEEESASKNNGGLENSYESVASTELSGTEMNPESEEFEQKYANTSQESQKGNKQESNDPGADREKQNSMQTKQIEGSGTTPEDIPPASNDDALAAQIRYAAENEPDPEKKKKLWNEYRKYKGLPTK